MFVLTACIGVGLCIIIPILLYWCTLFFAYRAKINGKIPALPMLPVLGSAYIFKNPAVLYRKVLEFRQEKGKMFWSMLGFEPMLMVMDAQLVEAILSSSSNIDKSRTYTYLHNWLGTGLLTSTGDKWRRHRKIITPAFHFKILEDFIPSFDSSSDILVDLLKEEVGKEWTDIFPYITLCTLDSVCESAMGTTVNAQRQQNSSYVRSVKEMCRIVMDRTISLMGQFDFTYQLTKDHRLETKSLKILHGYTNSVIRRRKEELTGKVVENVDGQDVGMKRRRAFLDLLLEYSREGNGMSEGDIREEVDTFMFEGHDTTAAAVTFCLHLLSKNRISQDKAFAEIRKIIGDDQERTATFKDLQDMKYLELVLKETLRLMPSVPIYARQLTEDLVHGDILIPKGMTVGLMIYVMHLDKDYFAEPHAFRPERFSMEEIATEKKNPFCYVPFSGGSRNCIGQRFAMLSMKSIVSKVLRKYDLFGVDHEMVISAETVLRSRNGVRVQIKERRW